MPYPKRKYSPAAAADIRRRYEHTDESIQSIGDRHKVHRTTLRRHITEQGWKRSWERESEVAPGPDVLDIADEELRAAAADRVAARRPAPRPRAAAGTAEKPSRAERMERLLEEHLSHVEAMRLQESPRSVTAAERTTRMLARMTEALFKVRQLRASEPAPQAPEEYDDWPVDIVAFRNELARRIRAFVKEGKRSRISE